ncbi:Terpene cyclase [Fulvia fulva]|uniref:Terpene cyclase n=1 Tax=Passalora fulva TaxID=5499 RepID=A0A9Q8L8L2_PASFU|nr:Terpene cyclase [Fulvia fulva]KAK4634311.1 Terpene cyclase [Fulvia fulva]KAK4636890.1 Terpene cyclase [Fulvia fulva]UJO12792.1 Terpene cyclase [Fulvia fulva]WPV08441.1 Terpene cyclase [Fulvia fulva]WPV23915.1 Terpene cyclase [Fulvia fulva]
MAYTRPIAITLLAGIVVTAHFSLGKQAENNGTFAIADVFTYTTRTLPNTSIPIRIPETGIAAVDNYFAFMVSFFWATLDTRNVRAHLQGHPLLGTLSSTWLLMLGETHRGGRGAASVFGTYFLEIMGELLGIGMFTGVWCIVHLISTSRPNASKSATGKTNLTALGWAMLIGYIVPTLGMIHCAPDGSGLASQQLWTILRLFHPIFVFTSYIVLSTIVPSSSASQGASGPRKFYIFSILASAFFHISAVGILLAPYLTPLWVKDEVTAALNIYDFYVPYPYWLDAVPRQVSFDLGVATFLQWDNLCSASAICVWAAALYVESGGKGRIGAFVQAGGVALLAGPGAAAAFLMLERDAAVAAPVVEGGKKQR